MNKKLIVFGLVVIALLLVVRTTKPVSAAVSDVQWGSTVTGGVGSIEFYDSVTDSAGNTYAVGTADGAETPYNLGNGVLLDIPFSIRSSAVLVKYNASGSALWVKSVSLSVNVALEGSSFNGITLAPTGDIIIAGDITNLNVYDFGNGVTAAGLYSSSQTAVLVKYNTSGVAQMAVTPVSAPHRSGYSGVDTDSNGNIYLVGYIAGNEVYDFGNSVTVASAANGALNSISKQPLIIKYSSSGIAQWARSTTVSPAFENYIDGVSSEFLKVAVSPAGTVYTVGHINGTDKTYGFGNGVTVTGVAANPTSNALLIKYSTDGLATWARTTSGTVSGSLFENLAIDADENAYVAGSIDDDATYELGNSVTVSSPSATGSNAVVAKYTSSGTAQWAKTIVSGTNASEFYGITYDPSGSGKLYLAGYAYDSAFDFGGGVTFTTTSSYGAMIILSYDLEGVPLWGKTGNIVPDEAYYQGVSTDSVGNVYVVGYVYGNSTFDLGDAVSFTSDDPNNYRAFIAKYGDALIPTPTPTPTMTPTSTPTPTPTLTPTPTPTIPASLKNLYVTFARLRYDKYTTNTLLYRGDTAYLKNYDPKKVRLLQVFLYDFAKKGNQGFSKSSVKTYSMFIGTNYKLPLGNKYAYVFKFQDKTTGIIVSKYFTFYTTKTWLGKSVL